MTDHESHFEFSNELLSAYLDDELTPEERAHVEKRLATDPLARQMLDELRAVSLAVRSLPAEAAGEDLRASILQRAERAMLTNPPAKPATSESRFPRLAESAELASQPTGSMLPKLTIGRTGRGWFWAGLAVAAALLISFFQPETGRDQKLPDIARRSPARRDEMHIGNAEMRALEPAPSNTDLAEAAPATVPPDNYEAAAAARPAAPASGSTPPVSAHGDSSGFAAGSAERALALHDKSADDAPRELGRPATMALHDGTVSLDESAAIREDGVLVVHVNVTQSAFANKSFDQILISNGIAVEPSPADKQLADRFARPLAEAGARSQSTSSEPSPDSQDVEVVFVEATPTQIEACLNALQNDSTNYAAIEIDEPSPSDQSPAKKWAVEQNWGKYNRGQVTPQQKAQTTLRGAGRPYLHFQQLPAGAATGGAGGIVAGAKVEAFRDEHGKAANQSRARRVKSLDNIDRALQRQELSRGVVAPEEAAGEENLSRASAVEDAIAEVGDNMRILFVLSPEPAAAASASETDLPE